MQAVILSLFSLAMLLCLAASIGLWITALLGLRQGRDILPADSRERYPGGIAEVLVAAGIWFFTLGVFANLYLAESPASSPGAEVVAEAVDPSLPDASRLVPSIVINSLATVAASVGVLAWMGLQGFSWRAAGLRFSSHHLGIGIRGLVLFLPPVMLLQAALTTLVEYSHPVLEILQQPQPVLVVLTMAISSTLIAPLTEEFFFRGLLQGWLERVAGVGQGEPPHEAETAGDLSAVSDGAALAAEPYTPATVDSQRVQPDRAFAARPYWPMVLSSLAFAAVHAGHGPAPISLFFLALGLGYLYRQTGSIWPSVIVHMALNGLTTAVTILTMTNPPVG